MCNKYELKLDIDLKENSNIGKVLKLRETLKNELSKMDIDLLKIDIKKVNDL